MCLNTYRKNTKIRNIQDAEIKILKIFGKNRTEDSEIKITINRFNLSYLSNVVLTTISLQIDFNNESHIIHILFDPVASIHL